MLVCTTMYCVDNLGWVGLMKAWCNELEWQTYIHNFTTHHSSFSNSTSCQSNCCIPPKFRRSFDFGREVKGVHLRNCTREGIQTIEDTLYKLRSKYQCRVPPSPGVLLTRRGAIASLKVSVVSLEESHNVKTTWYHVTCDVALVGH